MLKKTSFSVNSDKATQCSTNVGVAFEQLTGQIFCPPLTWIRSPVIQRASSEAKKAITSAISLG